MFRFIAVLWQPEVASNAAAAAMVEQQLKLHATGWTEAFAADGIQVYCTEEHPVARLNGNAGVILGTLFEWPKSGGNAPPRLLDIDEPSAKRIVSSKGQVLLTEYWGNYVAIVSDIATYRILVIRSPTGNLPCYAIVFHGITVLVSCIADAVQLPGVHFPVNEAHLGARVCSGWLSAGLELIDGITELRGGECLEVQAGRSERNFRWSPVEVANAALFEDHADAARRLRNTMRACTQALASCYDSTLHRLSGGIDSSVVFSALADGPCASALTCLTYFVPEGRSDERPFARLAAGSRQARLIEHPRTAQIDLRRILETQPTAAPTALSPYVELGDFERQLCGTNRRVGRFSGLGGDSVFARTSARLSAADYARRHGFDRRLLSIAAQTARLTGQSFWTVFVRAMSDRRQTTSAAHREYRERALRAFVAPDALDARQNAFVIDQPIHPWFAGHVTPASVVFRLGSLVDIPSYYNPLSSPDVADPEPVLPLFAQPLVELCLQIPTYVHNFDGRDRGLARLAFADDLPPQVINRQWKDRAPGFFEDIFRHNAAFLQEFLMEGALQRMGLLDRDKLAAVFSSGLTRFGQFLPELLDHACVEAWYRALSEPPKRAAT